MLPCRARALPGTASQWTIVLRRRVSCNQRDPRRTKQSSRLQFRSTVQAERNSGYQRPPTLLPLQIFANDGLLEFRAWTESHPDVVENYGTRVYTLIIHDIDRIWADLGSSAKFVFFP